MSAAGSVGIVGGGLLGLTVAHRLAGRGIPVTVYEASGQFGGLAGSVALGGRRADRFYHVVLPTDDRVTGLCEELGLGARLRFRRTQVGFFHAGRLASMSSLRDLACFPGLRPADRMRIVAFVARCQVKASYDDLEDIALEAWLRRVSGDRLWEQIWRPLLDSKFDGRHADLPATYLWARTRRMSGARDRGSHEVMGTIDGGYQRLVDALVASIRRAGGRVLRRAPVTRVVADRGRAVGVLQGRVLHPHALVLTTQLRPTVDRLLDADLRRWLGPDPNRYLGIVQVLARVRRSVSPYYALNLTDRRVPLTTIVESTHVVDPQTAGGTLIYLPRYVDPRSPQLERSDDELRDEHLAHLRAIFPAFDPSDVEAADVARARVAEPVHVLGAPRRPPILAAPGLAVASSAHVYPELVNGQAILGLAEEVADALAGRVGTREPERRAA